MARTDQHIGTGIGSGIGWGTLAATVAFVLQLPLAAGSPVTVDAFVLLSMIPFVLWFSALIVAVSLLVVGVPVVALLARIECDGAEVLALAGAVAGIAIVWAITLASGSALGAEERLFALTAAAGGGVAGAAWGRVRDRLAAEAAPRHAPGRYRMDDARILR